MRDIYSRVARYIPQFICYKKFNETVRMGRLPTMTEKTLNCIVIREGI